MWIIPYALMGVAVYLVWQKRTKEECHCGALQLFLLQLALNALWAYLFFVLKEPLLAFIEIVILLFVILIVIWQFWRISKAAAYLLFPYAAWGAFAAYSNFGNLLSN